MFRALTTWLWRTHSFSSSELSYSSGEMFRALTTCSNELGKKMRGWIASGFVKSRFMRRRRIRHLNSSQQELPAPCTTAPEVLASEASRFLFGTGVIDVQCTFVQQSAVQSGNGFVCIRRIRHLHKAEPAWFARVAVGHNANPVHRPECCENLTERLFRRAGT